MNNSIHSLLVISVTLLIQGCDVSVTQEPQDYLVRAGQSYITASDLDHHLSTFEEGVRAEIVNNPLATQKLLESIAMSQLMAEKQEKNLSELDRLTLEASVTAYRRQKLAADYISDTLNIKTPSLQGMRSYYDSHTEFFGSTVLYSVQVYSFTSDCSFPNSLFKSHDLDDISSKLLLEDCGSKNQYQDVKIEKLQQELGGIPEKLEVDKGVWISTSFGQTYIYCSSITEGGAKPFSEVIPEVRKYLATAYLKDALANERKKLNKEIEFFD